jgi:hypothetical protein
MMFTLDPFYLTTLQTAKHRWQAHNQGFMLVLEMDDTASACKGAWRMDTKLLRAMLLVALS